MKLVFATIVLLAILASVCSYQVHQWGSLQSNSYLLHRERIRVVNTLGKHRQVRDIFHYPEFVDEENVEISCVRVVHQGRNDRTDAVLQWGGPPENYVGVELISEHGRGIDSIVEVYH